MIRSRYFYIMRVVPTSATTTSMQYEVFRHKDASDEEFKELDDFFKQVENEDKNLCNGAQRNLNAGVYVNGELQPFNEKVRLEDKCTHLSQEINPPLLGRPLFSKSCEAKPLYSSRGGRIQRKGDMAHHEKDFRVYVSR